LGRAFGEGAGLTFAGAGGIVKRLAEAVELGLQVMDAFVEGPASRHRSQVPYRQRHGASARAGQSRAVLGSVRAGDTKQAKRLETLRD
jgi:hypothetical protein